MEWKKCKKTQKHCLLPILITVSMKVLLHKQFYFESALEVTQLSDVNI